MLETDPTRRGFLKLTGSALSASWLTAQWPAMLALGQTACQARDNGSVFVNLDSNVAADLAAIAARIIPSDDTPGADEAGVIYFIDGALDTVMKGAAGFLRDGVAELNRHARKNYGNERFAGLAIEQQIDLLKQEDQSAFFGAVKFLTVAGMFAMPLHGGNRNLVGWELLGFDSKHGWQPPFGYYDARELSGG
ncbi:MAG: gluconate 2-dehydrogenase subunit 3 family protein [Gammaproteobacteria bacterium]|nr:gluconate 2-dehydrogenase subunit 3 family protein [Gammaproteobacteria bacterium]